MTKEKTILYSKAFVELYEIIKKLNNTQREKIPEDFIEYINNNKDSNYIFNVDCTKGLYEQDCMVETKALLIKIYEKYIAQENEKEFWDKYDKLCFEKREDKKREQCNYDNIFKNDVDRNIIKQETSLIEYKDSLFKRLVKYIKNVFQKQSKA